ncbi:MAG: FG-GAP repeat protein [Polyangia bacterium]
MRTQLFGRLLPLALLCTAPQTGCSDLFASYLRFGDTSDGGVADAGEPVDLLGLDLTGVDLTGFPTPDMTPPPPCDFSPGATTAAPNLPFLGTETQLAGNLTDGSRVAIGDFDKNGLADIAIATHNVGNGNVSVSVLLQTAACTFTPMPVPIPSATASGFVLQDFRALPINTVNATRPQWDIGLLGLNKKLIWCRHNSGQQFDCISSDVPDNIVDTTKEKRFVVDERGRVHGDFVLIHQKGAPDFVVRVLRSGTTFTSTKILPGTVATLEPGIAVGARFGEDAPVVGMLGYGSGGTTTGVAEMSRSSGANYIYAFTPPTAATINPFESYLYAGHFTADDFDDLISLPKSGSRPLQTFEFKGATAAQPTGTLTLNATARDLVAVNDLDGNGLDELTYVTTGSMTIQPYKYSAGTLSTAGPGQSLGHTIVGYAIGQVGPSHSRPDIVYIDGTKVYIRRANPAYVP